MPTASPVDELIDRVTKAGVPMAAVCEEAGVAESTPSRWRAGLFEPKLRTINRLNAALDRLLARTNAPQAVG